MLTCHNAEGVHGKQKVGKPCKAYRKPSRAFNCSLFFQTDMNRMELNCRVKRCGFKNQKRRQ